MPERYDEQLQLSMTGGGVPFVESVLTPQSVTITRAEGESPDRPDVTAPADLSSVTMTKVQSEAPDAQAGHRATEAGAYEPLEPQAAFWAITKTSAPGEQPDR
jgi:hypothetical protein